MVERLIVASSLAGLAAIGLGGYLYLLVSRKDTGTPKMRQISGWIREGAVAYLKREYQVLAIFVLIVAGILAVALRREIALAYVIGAASSGLAGLLGMDVALKANARATAALRVGLVQAFSVAFWGGAVMGLAVVGFALFGMSALYYLYRDPNIILGFSFGASTVALFAKAGGGIYTKTADIGADLVGKVELGIPEDDPRNPAVIADNVGDNVGDVAGMGADIFDSYVASVVAAMVIGSALIGTTGPVLPLLFSAAGIVASVIGMISVGVRRADPGAALNRGTLVTCLAFAIFAYLMIRGLQLDPGILYATVAGLAAGIAVGITSDYFTSIDRSPTQAIARASKTGPSINILTGFSYGLLSATPPIIGICVASVAAWHFAGLFGVAMSAVGMLAVTGMIVSSDAYGPIVDNARGIAEQSGMGEKVIGVADRLDAVGNTAKAVTKGFAIGAAALTVIALLVAYAELVGIESINLMDPYVIAGIFVGALMPPVFSALTILGVGRNAFTMVEEVRRQFKEIPGLLEGKASPDYTRCVDIATKGALKELLLPGILAVIVPPLVGLVLGTHALGGFLAGGIVSGIVFALLMANAGGAWDNAKKYIEAGAFGGKGSFAHKAAVVGDTVGDPFKDTAGPSINTLLVVMSLSASIFAPLIIKYALLG